MNDSARKNRIRSPLLFIGLFFLINPYFAALDILPDLIGYLILIYCISDLKKAEYRVEAASRTALYLALLSLCRAGAFVLSLGSDDSMRLLLTFAFGVAETLLVIRFANELFGGTEYLLQRYGGYEALEKISNAKFLTLFFFIARVVMSCIPEAAVLLVQKVLYSELIDVDDIPLYNDLASYKPYAAALFLLVCTIMGVWWFTVTVRFFSAIRKDERFLTNVNAATSVPYGEKTDTADRIFSASYVLTAIGAVLYFDIYFDRIPVLPACLGTVFMALAIARVKREEAKKLIPYAVCAAIIQLAFDVCFKLFGATSVNALGEMPLFNTALLASVACVCASASVIFVRKFFTALIGLYREYGCEKTDLRYLIYAERLFTAYALMNIPAFSLPTLYPWLLLPRLACSAAFIVLLLMTCWRLCEECVKKTDDIKEL